MECDWEIEIAPEGPVIEAAWDGFIDLRREPSRISQIDEAMQFPALNDVLTRLNSHASPVWTAKCDLWVPESFDADELDASPGTAAFGLASYIDLIPVDARASSALDPLVDWCKQLCRNLQTRPLSSCRVDAIVRRSCISSDEEGLGVTAYVSACGPSPEKASQALSAALTALADSVFAVGGSTHQPSKYNRSNTGE